MDYSLVIALEMVRAVAWLVLLASGLAIIFGMMRIINFAHGEFLMLGGYTVVISARHGVNEWFAMLVLAPIVVGIFGVLVERLVIQRLYGRILDSLLATWGLSMLMIGGVTMIFGNSVTGVATPLGGMSIGDYQVPRYNFVLIFAAIALLVAIWAALKFTKAGLIARATMQNPDMSEALGIPTRWVYMATFGIGSAVTGFAGALLAPMTGVVPTMGVNFIAQSFITVITGGASVIAGTLTAAGLLGSISQGMTFLAGPVYGDAALLLAALVLLRLLPQGITGRIFKKSL
ncbi:urea ABC transporter [Salipiger aestuarii]|uniref:Branched-chain amino acid transport system permease protein n=1 Tax=Salipiger aestuarii TaxID=568098 RepID=A0A327YFT2_9RHOB|nr:branched-chain amino acid ABC transporter permease [Salipiger aestuarii]EIE51440.1 urea or short-chain amide ABC transporter [Citreicella sp. 357]KAA8608938.1 urea ABC transporter [Salipiger aestuarii]KAA8613140.1 urea ABC transporter [Salipiger aestuarii]KAB2543005.1 urea ABC transporter [Salipiger aestuarii]RAK19734.1 branched-chain amino acid transport system permease protein [Salipiger aestuarii]